MECPLPCAAWSGPEVEMATRGQLSIFFKGQYFMATPHTGSTVNPVLGVNILSFADEGEFIYVRDMFCLLIGCGNAWRHDSDFTLCKSDLLRRQALREELE